MPEAHLNPALMIEQKESKCGMGRAKGTRGHLGHFLSDLKAGMDAKERPVPMWRMCVDTVALLLARPHPCS